MIDYRAETIGDAEGSQVLGGAGVAIPTITVPTNETWEIFGITAFGTATITSASAQFQRVGGVIYAIQNMVINNNGFYAPTYQPRILLPPGTVTTFVIVVPVAGTFTGRLAFIRHLGG